MGASYGSIHVWAEDASPVRLALEGLASEGAVRFLLAPQIRGWVSILPSNRGQDWAVSEQLAKRLSNDVLHWIVHSDAIFAYRLYRGGALVDEYESTPGYFDFASEGPSNPPPKGGDAALLREYLPNADRVSDLHAILRKEHESFEQVRLNKFAKLLALPNACSSYEYARDGDREGIEQWKRFVHVPDLSIEKAARRDEAAALRRELKHLQAKGLLLVDERAVKSSNPHFTQHPAWAIDPATSTVLVIWTDASSPEKNAHCKRYTPPNWKPEPLSLSASTKASKVMFSGSGHWLAIQNAAGNWSVEVWDWRNGTRHAEMTFESSISAIAFDSNDQHLLVLQKSTLHFVPLADGRKKESVPLNLRPCRTLAAHPEGRWLAVNSDGQLALVDLLEPNSISLFGLGGFLDFAENMHLRIPKEHVMTLAFSPDGRWLICGTNHGARVFDWTVLSRSTQISPLPDFSINTHDGSPDELDSSANTYVYATAFDVENQRVLCGCGDGRIRYLDLASGVDGILPAGPKQHSVIALSLSDNRNAIVVTRKAVEGGARPPLKLQVWSYPLLCASAGIPH